MDDKDLQDQAEKLGDAIRIARMEQRVSQEELGLAIGTSQSYIARLELGQLNLSIAVLIRIADALDRDVRDFFDC